MEVNCLKFNEAKKLNFGDIVSIKADGRNEKVTNVTITYDHTDPVSPTKITNLTALIFCNDGNVYRHNELSFA